MEDMEFPSLVFQRHPIWIQCDAPTFPSFNTTLKQNGKYSPHYVHALWPSSVPRLPSTFEFPNWFICNPFLIRVKWDNILLLTMVRRKFVTAVKLYWNPFGIPNTRVFEDSDDSSILCMDVPFGFPCAFKGLFNCEVSRHPTMPYKCFSDVMVWSY